VAVVSWQGVSLLVQFLSGGMGHPPVASLLGDVHDEGHGDGEHGQSRHNSQQRVLPGKGPNRGRVSVGGKGDRAWASPQPSAGTAVALVLSMVLVLVVQVGVWLLVVGSGRSDGDGVGSVASFWIPDIQDTF
jgi:hypothetical protein